MRVFVAGMAGYIGGAAAAALHYAGTTLGLGGFGAAWISRAVRAEVDVAPAGACEASERGSYEEAR